VLWPGVFHPNKKGMENSIECECRVEKKNDFWSQLNSSEQNEIKKGTEELNQGKSVLYDSFLKKIS
jgi:hypothetical protein